MTLLCNSRSSGKRALIREIKEEDPLYRDIPRYLSRSGLRVWEAKTHRSGRTSDDLC